MPTELNNLYLASGGTLALAFGTSATKIYGSVDADTVTIAAGVTAVLDGSFNRGNDTIKFTGNAASYSIVRLNASTVKITDASGTSVTIPVGSTGTQIQFADATRTLSGSSAGIVLGDQAVTATASALPAGAAPVLVESYTLSVNSPSVTEGDTGSKTLSYKLTLDKAPTSTVTVSYETLESGTATANDDFVPAAGTVTFAAGQTVAFVSVTVLGDTTVEAPETIKLNLSGSKLVAPVQATGTIVDNEVVVVEQTAYTVTSGQIATADAQQVPVTVNVGDTGNKTVTIQSDADSADKGVIISGNATVSVTAGAAGDSISVSGNANNTIDVGAGSGNDKVYVYGTGNNTIYVGAGNDIVVGGSGNDTIVVAAGDLNALDSFDGGAGYDTVVISGDNNVADYGVGGNLVNIERLVLDGTSVTITEADLEAAIAGGLVSIEGHPTSSVVTITSVGGTTVDLTGLNLSGVKELKVDAIVGGNGAVSIKLSAAQIAAIGKITEFVGDTLTLNTTVAGYQALGAKAPGVTVTITDTAQNLIAAGNSISGVTALLGDATVAEAQAALSSGLTVSYRLVDTAANLALAPLSAYNAATGVTATDAANVAQAKAIQDSLLASSVMFGTANVVLNVIDTASNISNYLFDPIDADTVVSTDGATLTVSQAAALAALNANATFKIHDTPAALAAAGNNAAMNRAAEITATGALTVAQVIAINAGTTDLKVGYALSDSYNNLVGAAGAVIAAAGNLTVTGGALTVAQAISIEALSNNGTNSYVLADSITSLLAASSAVVSATSAVATSTDPLTVSQINSFVSKFGTTKVNDNALTVTDTLANLLQLSAGSVGEATTITIASGVGTAQDIVNLKTLTGAKIPAAFTVTDSAANLSAAFADATKLTLLNGATAVNVTGAASVAQISALNASLNGETGGRTAVAATYALSDTAANLALVANNAVVQAAATVAITGVASVAQVNTINGLATVDPTGFALTDTAANLAAGTTAVDNAGAVTVTGTATVAQIGTIAASYTATGADAVLGTDLVFAISDGAAAFDGASVGDLAILNAATSATLVDTVANLFAVGVTTAERDVADVVIAQDTLINLTALSTDQKAEIDRLTITDTTLDASNAAAVNALAAVKPTTYSIIDAYTDIVVASPTAALTTYLANAKTVTVDATPGNAAYDSITVAQFNTLDALTGATIQTKVSGTVAELSAANAATAVAAAIASGANGGVTVSNTAASVSQAETLLARLGSSHAGVTALVVTDTAASIQNATTAAVNAVNSFVVSDNGLITGSTVLVSKVFGADGSKYGNYAIVDTAANIVAANAANPSLVQFARSVTVIEDSTLATQAQADTLGSLTAMGPISYSINDMVANIAAGTSAGRNGATNISVATAATVAEAVVIDGATNSGTTGYSITDTAANLATAVVANVAAIEHAAGYVTASSAATGAQASTIAAFTKAVKFDVSDTAANVAASTGLAEARHIAVTNMATAAEAATVMGAANSGTTTISAVSGTAAAVGALVLGANDTITTLSVTDTTTIADAIAINAKDTGTNIGTLSFATISGTYAQLLANATVANLATAGVTVTGTMTVAEAAALDAAINPALAYSITDSLANIMADKTVGGTVDNTALYAGHRVTVTDAALTIAQATVLRTVGAASYGYAIADNDANLVASINGNSAVLTGATSVAAANGSLLALESIAGQLAIVGTRSALNGLSTVLQGAEKVYEVTVAELAASPDFFVGLNGTQAYRVTDTIANLISGNALLPSATSLVASDAVTVAQAQSLATVGTGVKVYSLTDTAAALAAVAGNNSVVDGAVNVVVSTAATFLQASQIEAEANSGTISYSISDTAANFGNASGDSLNAAIDITVTGTVNQNTASTLLAANNTGRTTIALVSDTAALVAGLVVASGDSVTAASLTTAATVAQLTSISGKVGSITSYSLSDTAANLAMATAAQLNAATNVAASTAVTVALAATLDGATNTGTTTFSIADKAANVLAGSVAVLAADANDEVVITDTTVTAAVATQLRALDAANNGINGFTIVQGGAAGVFVISDTVANLTAAANLDAVNASTDVRVTGNITVAEANLVRAIDLGDADGATYSLSDTYSRLVAGLTTTQEAVNVTITNQVSVSQANSAVANFQAAQLTMDVRDTASAVASGLAASSAGLAAAAHISLSSAGTVAQAARLSELSASLLVGGYAITDTAANVASAINTANAVNASDRATVLGATSVTLSGAATVAEALGVRNTETRGLYTIAGLSYSISDSAANIVAGLASSDGVGIENASSVLLSTSAGITLSQATTLTGLSHFGGYDGAGRYAVADAYATVQAADTTLLANATSVTANDATAGAHTIDMSGISRAVTVTANDGNDTVFGTDYADTIVGGTGADDLTGGAGRDAFAVTSGDSLVGSYDQVFDFTLAAASWTGSAANDTVGEFQALTIGGAGADILDLTTVGTLVVEANGTGNGVVAATYTVTNGILTLSGAGASDVDTLGEWLVEAAAVSATAGETIGFEFGGNTYVFTPDGANVSLVELNAVTGVNGLSLLANAGAVGGNAYIIIG